MACSASDSESPPSDPPASDTLPDRGLSFGFPPVLLWLFLASRPLFPRALRRGSEGGQKGVRRRSGGGPEGVWILRRRTEARGQRRANLTRDSERLIV
eukprot:1196375-Prorocentrum_minimum.AAC.1